MKINSAQHNPALPPAAGTQRASEQFTTLNQVGRRIQELIEEIESLSNPAASELLHACLESVLTFYGQGLAQVLQVVKETGHEGEKVMNRLLNDPGVRGLLLIHGLHPVDLETRLHEALSKVRPYMESHGGNVELVSLENDIARLRFQGSCKGCPSSAITMELAIRHAIEEACPDLQGLEVEGVVESAALSGRVDSPDRTTPHANPTWTVLEDIGHLRNDDMTTFTQEDVPLVICKLNEKLYAYRNVCPVCHDSFKSGALVEGYLLCPTGHRYDARHAGLCPEDPNYHLDPIPLLVQNGQARIALGQAHRTAQSHAVAMA